MIVFILFFALILTCLAWRYLIRCKSLPCPSWLSPILDNPFTKLVAGSETLLDRARVEQGMNILDMGCGPGRLSIPAAERVGPSGLIVALDIQKAMLRKCEARIKKHRLTNIRLVHAGAGEGAVKRNFFDRVFLVTVLGEIQDRARALREMYDALKPRGVLSVTEVFPDPHYQGRTTVRTLGERAGFRLEERFGGFPAFTMNFIKDRTPLEQREGR